MRCRALLGDGLSESLLGRLRCSTSLVSICALLNFFLGRRLVWSLCMSVNQLGMWPRRKSAVCLRHCLSRRYELDPFSNICPYQCISGHRARRFSNLIYRCVYVLESRGIAAIPSQVSSHLLLQCSDSDVARLFGSPPRRKTSAPTKPTSRQAEETLRHGDQCGWYEEANRHQSGKPAATTTRKQRRERSRKPSWASIIISLAAVGPPYFSGPW
jgi:hypothetical protein